MSTENNRAEVGLAPRVMATVELDPDMMISLISDDHKTNQLSINDRMQIVDYARIAATKLYCDGTINSDSGFPIDAYAVANKLGIIVEQAEIPPDSVTGEKPAGLIYKPAGLTPPYILVQKGLDARHQLFTACHELGHYLLWQMTNPSHNELDAAWGDVRPDHSVIMGGLTDADDHEDQRPSEFAANTFAHMLLMPDAAVVALLQAGNTVSQLADFFSVTKKSVRRRLSYFDIGSQTY